MRYFYVAVESNIYELPVAVAESPRELASMIGVSVEAIVLKMSRARRENLWCEFVRIPKEGDYTLPTPEEKGELIKQDRRKKKLLMVSESEMGEFDSVTEAAAYVGADISSVRRWIKKGYGRGCTWKKI